MDYLINGECEKSEDDEIMNIIDGLSMKNKKKAVGYIDDFRRKLRLNTKMVMKNA